jgi:hypothetical protein
MKLGRVGYCMLVILNYTFISDHCPTFVVITFRFEINKITFCSSQHVSFGTKFSKEDFKNSLQLPVLM